MYKRHKGRQNTMGGYRNNGQDRIYKERFDADRISKPGLLWPKGMTTPILSLQALKFMLSFGRLCIFVFLTFFFIYFDFC